MRHPDAVKKNHWDVLRRGSLPCSVLSAAISGGRRMSTHIMEGRKASVPNGVTSFFYNVHTRHVRLYYQQVVRKILVLFAFW